MLENMLTTVVAPALERKRESCLVFWDSTFPDTTVAPCLVSTGEERVPVGEEIPDLVLLNRGGSNKNQTRSTGCYNSDEDTNSSYLEVSSMFLEMD